MGSVSWVPDQVGNDEEWSLIRLQTAEDGLESIQGRDNEEWRPPEVPQSARSNGNTT